MRQNKFVGDLQSHFIDSLFFESDEGFRRHMALLVKRSVGLIGFIGPVVLLVFIAGQVIFLGKTPTFTYRGQVPQLVTVLWDKLAMLSVFATLLFIRPWLPEDRPTPGRIAMVVASMLIVVVITLDDVALLNVSFTPAYVTMVVLLLAGAVPMRPFSLLLATGLIVGSWYFTVTALPGLIDFQRPVVNGEQIVFLVVISIISTAAASLLYNVRHEEFLARKSAEDLSRDLARTNQSLEQAIDDLKTTQDRLIYAEKMASLGRFASGVAHELRNPLNFVSNFAKLSVGMLDEADEDSGGIDAEMQGLRENLERIRGHAARAENIVKSLIAHTQQRSSQPERVEVNQLMSDQASVLSRRYNSDGSGLEIVVDLRLDESLGELYVYPAELAAAMAGILDNAFLAARDRFRAGEEGYQPRIEVTTSEESDGARIEVRDNGVGMSEEVTTRIFEPFYTTRPTGSGTGLGLASAYAAVTEGHGGSIEVRSRPGDGSTFIVRIKNVSSDRIP